MKYLIIVLFLITAVAKAQLAPTTVIDFSRPEFLTTFTITDEPRGYSKARLEFINGTLIFSGGIDPGSGEVGFASIRMQNLNGDAWDLSNKTEVSILAWCAPGKYRMLIRDEDALLSPVDYSFQVEITCDTESVQEFHFPLKDFKPFLRGVQMPEDIILNPAKISQWGFMATSHDMQNFELQIREFKTR